MPFYALPYHIGVRKGMEGHQYIIKGFFGQYKGKGRKGTVHELEFAASGRACPSMLCHIIWGLEGHERASIHI